ncbi:YjbF family lipoprotein [Paracraurococcus ruber]|nr:YjbF family lipoprotein [Paracraurococcus ruber]
MLGGCGDTLWARLMPATAPAEDVAEPTGPALRLNLRGQSQQAALIQALGERRLWRTGGNRVVATDGGRVVATSGFGEMLAATRFDGPDPLADPAALLDRPASARRLVDLMRADRAAEGMRFGVPVECRLSARAIEEDAGVLLVEERCRAAGAGRFTNRFWVAAQAAGQRGTVLRAQQWIGPGLPLLTLDFPEPEEPPAATAAR